MDRVFKFMNTLFNDGYSIQIYEYTIQAMDRVFKFMNTLFSDGYSIQIYEYTIQ